MTLSINNFVERLIEKFVPATSATTPELADAFTRFANVLDASDNPDYARDNQIGNLADGKLSLDQTTGIWAGDIYQELNSNGIATSRSDVEAKLKDILKPHYVYPRYSSRPGIIPMAALIIAACAEGDSKSENPPEDTDISPIAVIPYNTNNWNRQQTEFQSIVSDPTLAGPYDAHYPQSLPEGVTDLDNFPVDTISQSAQVDTNVVHVPGPQVGNALQNDDVTLGTGDIDILMAEAFCPTGFETTKHNDDGMETLAGGSAQFGNMYSFFTPSTLEECPPYSPNFEASFDLSAVGDPQYPYANSLTARLFSISENTPYVAPEDMGFPSGLFSAATGPHYFANIPGTRASHHINESDPTSPMQLEFGYHPTHATYAPFLGLASPPPAITADDVLCARFLESDGLGGAIYNERALQFPIRMNDVETLVNEREQVGLVLVHDLYDPRNVYWSYCDGAEFLGGNNIPGICNPLSNSLGLFATRLEFKSANN